MMRRRYPSCGILTIFRCVLAFIGYVKITDSTGWLAFPKR
jgi:hypothetical protein